MAYFEVKFETDNAAFDKDSGDGPAEIARVLQRVARAVLAGEGHGRCMDTNGNRVGEWEHSGD
jgi:hypothetical protein|tara:strand:+ start:140 stop:328 length:189 start_codon:yes stop_codon:yes gene_type:complete